jgi:hypothetical protein
LRILEAEAQFVGNGVSTCTHQTKPSADGHRWCGFIRGAKPDAPAELWVIDVTLAAGGAVPPCDGTSDRCLRLTDKLPPRSAPLFGGDTLIYGTDAVSGPNEDFLGRMFAWRPGWSGGRQISSNLGFTCAGQQSSTAAVCLDDPEGDPTNRAGAQVRVGYLDGEQGGALPAVGRWPLRNDNSTAWEATFSPDGSLFALSSAPGPGQKQDLTVLRTGDAGSAKPVGTLADVAYIRISNDGRAIYFVRGLPDQADLYVADFPSGAGARLLEAGILHYELIGERSQDQALGFVKDLGETKGEFKLLADRRQATPKSIFTYEDILDGAIVSPDLRYTAWLDFAFRGVVIRNADLAACQMDLEEEPPVYEPVFLDHASLLFWKETRPGDSSHRDGFFAAPDRCRPKTQFATDLDFVVPVGDRGIVFADEVDRMTDLKTLKYAMVAADGSRLDARGPVLIHEGVDSSVVFVGPPSLLVYRAVGPSPESTGIFVYGPLPF